MNQNMINKDRKSSDEMPEIFSIGGNQKRIFFIM